MLSTGSLLAATTALAVFYGLVWMAMNLYNYYPVARAAGVSLLTGQAVPEAAFVGTDGLDVDDESVYPEIDVLVPGYNESSVIHQSVKSIREAEYPQEHLSLTVLLEPDDVETIARVRELKEYIDFELIIVPEAYPGTQNKPRALNYGFEQTDGDIVGVIDAENVVSSGLFDRVADAIVREENAYVQGIVDMVNEEDGWKNLLFRAEYGYWYRLILPAFKRLDFPIPLSGTTCFFRRDVLRSISQQRRERKAQPWTETDSAWLEGHGLSGITPWDPDNVTEDFELGLQLWASDYRFGIIDAVTKEESPQTLENWIKQRTRWQKGKVFTFIDFFKHRAGSSMRERGHLLWQSFLPHAGPLNVTGLVFLIAFGSAIGFVPPNAFVEGVLLFGLAFLFVSVIAFVLGYWFTSTKPPMHKLTRAVIVAATTPLYWVLQWAADVRAFKQLAVGDLGWEKTIHENNERLEQLQQGPSERASLGGQLRATVMNNLLLWPILLVALVLRVPRLDRSLWIDEVYSVTARGSADIGSIITTVADPHPPLYYLTLHGWMQIFGTSPVAVRSLSVLLGVSSIGAIYLLADELYDTQTGLIAALLVSLSSFHIQYSQTARMYSMLVFFGTLSLLFYARCLNDHNFDNRLGYATATVAMLLTHPYGSFVLVGQLLHLVIGLYQEPDRQAIRRWAGTETLAITPFVPWMALVAVRRYLVGSRAETSWLSKVNINELRDVGLAYVGVPVNYPTLQITSYTYVIGHILLFAVLLIVLWRLYSEWGSEGNIRGATLLISVLVGLVGIPFAISATVFPFFDIRYVIVGVVAVMILVAKSVSSISYSTARMVALALVITASVSMLPVYFGAEHSEPWDEAASSIEERDSDALVVAVPGFTKKSFKYHLAADSAVKTVRYRSAERTGQAVSNATGSEFWVVVRTRGPSREPFNWSAPPAYEPVLNESFGRLDIIKYADAERKPAANNTATEAV